jgi:hypothetical protein
VASTATYFLGGGELSMAVAAAVIGGWFFVSPVIDGLRLRRDLDAARQKQEERRQ